MRGGGRGGVVYVFVCVVGELLHVGWRTETDRGGRCRRKRGERGNCEERGETERGEVVCVEPESTVAGSEQTDGLTA